MDKATIEISGNEKVLSLSQKEFKSGSDGYHATGKLVVGEEKYQLNILAVRCGSKPQ